MQKRLAALSRAKTRVKARGLRSDGYWEEIEVGKRWRLARDGDWQEVEVGKRWRLARGGGWQEVTKAHKYDICKIQNNTCPHSAFKCANCGENHRVNSPKYEIVKKITKKYSKELSSNQKQLDNMNWQT